MYADGDRQDLRRRDGGVRAARSPLAAADGAAGVQPRALRAQGERGAALRVPGRARARRLVHRRDDRHDDACPTVPLDSEVLAGLSVGLPIGLGVYLAWVHRDWSAATKAVGFAAAVGGALVGAWLGFNATAGMLALITTSPGPPSEATSPSWRSTSRGTGRLASGSPSRSHHRHSRAPGPDLGARTRRPRFGGASLRSRIPQSTSMASGPGAAWVATRSYGQAETTTAQSRSARNCT